MGRSVDVSPARQVKSPIPEMVSVSQKGPREGTTGGGLLREAHPVAMDFPSQVSAPECKVSAEKKSKLGSQARKGNLLEGKREGDWLLRRTSIPPF